MNLNESDSINGKSPGRQTLIWITHIVILIASWIVIIHLHYLILMLAGFEKQASQYLEKGYFIPSTLLLWSFLWIHVFIIQKRGWFNPKGNGAQASYNTLWHQKLPDGGTRFIVNETGFAPAYLWQKRQGQELELDKEVTLDCGGSTICIKRISLEIELVITYRIWQRGLSRFLQNTLNVSNGEPKILEHIKASANQFMEVAACNLPDATTEKVRQEQTNLTNTVLEQLQREGTPLGIEILSLKFKKCDYSSTTQNELNKVLEAEGIKEIALSMGFDDANKHRAFELAAVIAGKTGAKSGREITEIIMDPHTADAIKAAGPAAAALLMSMFRNNGKKPT